MKNPKIKTIVSELRKSFEALYGDRLINMILFGSHARGDAEPGSDIDVLVVLKEPVSLGAEITRTSEMRSQLSLKYNVVVSCTYVSTKRYTTEQSPLLINIRREGITAPSMNCSI
jgi:predicted nucleotidyltransferase